MDLKQFFLFSWAHGFCIFFAAESLPQGVLNYKSNRRKIGHDTNIEDVMDGKLYRTHFDTDGFFVSSKKLEKEVHISLQINTDGVSLFRSSKFSVWPVYLVINEIPPKSRFAKQSFA